MRGESLVRPPSNGEAIHQVIDQLLGIAPGMGGQVGIFGGGQDASVAEDFLHLKQVDTATRLPRSLKHRLAYHPAREQPLAVLLFRLERRVTPWKVGLVAADD